MSITSIKYHVLSNFMDHLEIHYFVIIHFNFLNIATNEFTNDSSRNLVAINANFVMQLPGLCYINYVFENKAYFKSGHPFYLVNYSSKVTLVCKPRFFVVWLMFWFCCKYMNKLKFNIKSLGLRWYCIGISNTRLSRAWQWPSFSV